MQTIINVKCGKPILKLSYKSLKAIQICSIISSVIIFLYSLNLFTVAIRLHKTVSIYIELISNNGEVFPGLISLCGILSIFNNIFVLYYLIKAFSGSKNKYMNSMLFMFVMVSLILIFFLSLICIFVLMHTYSSHEEVHDGIITAMQNYSKDSLTKVKVDMMQVENACCGSKNYTDWYDIKWYDANLINTGKFPSLQGETPYSCCSMQSVYPCIHHGIEVTAKAYNYNKGINISISTEGCHSVILRVKRKTGWTLVLRILVLMLLEGSVLTGLRFIQTAHTERKGFDREEKIYTSWLFGCYAGKTKRYIPPPVPPLPPELAE